MTPEELTTLIARLADEAGFARVGVARAETLQNCDYVDDWLDAGKAGEMHYLDQHRELRRDPCTLLDNARSVIVVADSYNQNADEIEDPSQGKVAKYAWGKDYHKILRKKLMRLADILKAEINEPFDTRVCVDTAPIIEREVAASAGIGWIGKNTCVIHPQLGSNFFLGEIITTLELQPSEPATNHCGNCSRCIEACPTNALYEPYRMDATRCISYLTIEHRSDIPTELQAQMSNWIFGCDICQDVCPFNRKAPVTAEPAYLPLESNTLTPTASLDELLQWTDEDRQRNFISSAMKRATLDMLKRNAAIAANNNIQRNHELKN